MGGLAVQAALLGVFVGGLWQVTPRRATSAAPSSDTTVVYLVGPTETPRASRRVGNVEAPPPAAPQTAVVAEDTAPAAPVMVPTGIPGPLVPGPAIGDGALWVTPRPALPGAVAEQLYGTQERRDSVAIRRLRALVDSLNVVLSDQQRAHELPSWTVGGENGKPKWGIDPKWVHLGDIKIPTPVLALLGGFLPQGNYLESERAEQLGAMRRDLLDAAWRAQTYQDFKRYVRETRERRQREHDEQRAKPQPKDTTGVIP